MVAGGAGVCPWPDDGWPKPDEALKGFGLLLLVATVVDGAPNKVEFGFGCD